MQETKEGEINKDKSTNFDSVIYVLLFPFIVLQNECNLTKGHYVLLDKTTLQYLGNAE